MCNRAKGVLAILLGLALSVPVSAKPVPMSAKPVPMSARPTDACRAHGQAALAAWTQGRFDQVGKDFAPVIAAKLTPALLRQVWGQLQTQAGTFKSLGTLAPQSLGGHDVLVAPLAFSGTSLAATVHCDGRDRIDGFRVVPAAAVKAAAGTPEPAIPETVSRALPVPSPSGPLRGTLTLPEGKGPFPAVVLVAGSGAHDQDETVGPNKPFRDLAAGLAKRGVASLRYDKRTFDYPNTWGDKGGLVIDSEVTVDAVAAARLLAATKHIDPHRVFVLGHSLGAMMAPRIGQRDPQLAGLVLMAAPARRIFAVLEQQVHDQAAKAGQSADAIAQAVQHYTKEQQLLAAVGPKQSAPKGDFDGVPQAYWLSWYRVDPVAEAKALSMPMLILQGGSDFQISPTRDFARWKQTLGGRQNVAFHVYPGLSHLFMPAGKTGTAADYQVPAHVDAQVIGAIATWIKAQPPASH